MKSLRSLSTTANCFATIMMKLYRIMLFNMMIVSSRLSITKAVLFRKMLIVIMIFSRSLLVVILILTQTSTSSAQQDYRAGSLTQLNLNFKLPNNLKLNTKLEARQIVSEKERADIKSNRFRYERTDLHFVLTRKISADNSLGGGYLIRLEDGKFTHRFIQQFNNVHTLDVLSVAHRVVLDETISDDDPFQVRLRYRLGLERALNGQSVDPKEFYIKFNNEYLGIWTNENTDLEIRGAAMIGYNATDDNKIELGPEYRVNEFYTGTKSQQFWLSVGWYLSF